MLKYEKYTKPTAVISYQLRSKVYKYAKDYFDSNFWILDILKKVTSGSTSGITSDFRGVSEYSELAHRPKVLTEIRNC